MAVIIDKEGKTKTVLEAHMPELKDAAEAVVSATDYKERFVAEYWELKIRYEKLKKFNNKIEAAEAMEQEPPKHDCPDWLLLQQQHQMGELLHTLEIRAVIENIDLGII